MPSRINLEASIPMDVRRLNAVARRRRCRFKRPLEALGEEIHFDSGDYHKLLDKLLSPCRWDKLQGRSKARQRQRRDGRRGALRCSSRRPGSGQADGVPASKVDTSGFVEVHHRRRLDRAGLRDRDGAGQPPKCSADD